MIEIDFSSYMNKDGTYPEYIQFLMSSLIMSKDMFFNYFLQDRNMNVYTPTFKKVEEAISYVKDNLTTIKVRYLKVS